MAFFPNFVFHMRKSYLPFLNKQREMRIPIKFYVKHKRFNVNIDITKGIKIRRNVNFQKLVAEIKSVDL